MQKRNRPAVDRALAPLNGVSRDGQPLSYNRGPAPDLAPWIARLYAVTVEAPSRHRMESGLLNDTACIRIQLAGDWTAETAEGQMAYGRSALFAGPQSRSMQVTVTGSFTSVGISLRPGACNALKGPKVAEHVDRIVNCDQLDGMGGVFLSALDPDASPEEWLQALEGVMRRIVEQAGGSEPDPVTLRFEALAFSDPTASIAEFARDCGIEQRRLERLVRRDFGMAPKQVLRRARALDMASHLRGVADREEADQLALRYYDQSHLIRDFSALFGMAPRQFVATPQPIMTIALESRQARRLEAISRVAPGAIRPWQ